MFGNKDCLIRLLFAKPRLLKVREFFLLSLAPGSIEVMVFQGCKDDLGSLAPSRLDIKAPEY